MGKSRRKLGGGLNSGNTTLKNPNNVKIRLKSSDGKEFQVNRKVACISTKLKKHLDTELDKYDVTISLDEVKGKVLEEILAWCIYHQDDEEDELDIMTAWDRDFLDKDIKWLIEVVTAAFHMEINGLQNLICKIFSEEARGKTPEQLAEYFRVQEGAALDPEQLEDLKREDVEDTLEYMTKLLLRED